MKVKNQKCPYLEAKCDDIQCDCPKYLAYVDAQDDAKVKAAFTKLNIDMNVSAWRRMYAIQKSFASRMHKVDDLKKEEIDYWVDKYLVCIDDEMREVREHLHLFNDAVKESEEQIIELRKEVIDIAHFMMDLFIVGNALAETIETAYSRKYMFGKDLTEDLITTAYSVQKMHMLNYINAEGKTDDQTFLLALCRMSDACGAVRQQISWKHWKKPNQTINFTKLYDAYALLFHEFIILCLLCIDNPNNVADIYTRKNAENIFRQEYGY